MDQGWTSLCFRLTLWVRNRISLFFLNCCFSASSATAAYPNEFREGGRTELISACGFNAAAYLSKHSFTAALVAELKDRSESENTFSVIGLHRRLLIRMKHFPRPERGNPSTPVYVLLAGNEHVLQFPSNVFQFAKKSSSTTIHLLTSSNLATATSSQLVCFRF